MLVHYCCTRIIEQLTCINGGFVDVPDSGGFYDIPYHKLFDGFVFWHAASAVGAPHGLNVATAVFGASSIAAFTSLKIKNNAA